MALFDKLKALFGRKKAGPKRYGSNIPGAGHRGIAVGSTVEGKRDLSAENIAKWRMLTGKEVEEFLYDGQPLHVHSTNVASAVYHIDAQTLILEYLDGAVWSYKPISEQQALYFAQAQSKGAWVWDNLRVRGVGGDGHHQPGITATQLRAGNAAMGKKHGKGAMFGRKK